MAAAFYGMISVGEGVESLIAVFGIRIVIWIIRGDIRGEFER